MKRGSLRLLAGLSAIVLVGAITRGGSRAERREGLKTLPYDDAGILASERPVYGGTLRVELGPHADLSNPESAAIYESNADIETLIDETLVRINGRGEIQPVLAETWERDASMRRWKFHLRSGMRFQDGTPLTPQNGVEGFLNGKLVGRVTPISDGLEIETPTAAPDLPVTLAQSEYYLAWTHSEKGLGGSGPFKLETTNGEDHVVLSANLDYWGGRPFLDSVDVRSERTGRERMIDLEVGKADLIELPPEMARRAGEEKIRVEATPPVELLALIFLPGRVAAENARLREAMSHAIDRAAIVNLVLQKEGEPASGLLPQWISGTEILIPSSADADAARTLAKEIAPAPSLVLGYDSVDALEQSVAERIAVNAREAGVKVTVMAIPARSAAWANAEKAKLDARIVRVSLASPFPRQALAGLIEHFDSIIAGEKLTAPESADAAEIYAREKAVIETYRVVPIAHLPRVYGLGPRVRNWSISPGTAMNGLPLADVWLKREAQ
jgi:peptide/nickel transport system substrate-binding protein